MPVKSVQELVGAGEGRPASSTTAAAIGIGPHFVFELFKRKAGVDIVHVPYRGGRSDDRRSDRRADPATMPASRCCASTSRAGKVRALAVAAAKRWDDLKDVPTMMEAGFLDAPYDTLFGIVAPAGVPAPIVERLNAVINEGLRSAEMRAGLDKLGIEPTITTPAEFAKLVAEEAPRWSEAVSLTGIKAGE